MVDVVVKQRRELVDAEAALTRYRRMCQLLALGFAASVLGLVGCAWLLSHGAGAEMWLVGIPAGATGVACFAAFINVVIAGNGNVHPADRVRRARRDLDDAIEAAADEAIVGWVPDFAETPPVPSDIPQEDPS